MYNLKTLLSILICLIGSATFGQSNKEKRPNIIVILADDLGYGDVSSFNEEAAFQTPHIDQLAENGIAFTHAYTTSSVCTPTRYGLLTGRYNWRSRLKQSVLSGFSKALIPPDRITVADVLRDQGYYTGFIGKWHLGWDWQFEASPENIDKLNSRPKVDFSQPVKNGPEELGFNYSYGFSGSLDMAPYVYVENSTATVVPTETSESKTSKGWWRKGLTSPDFVHQEVLPHLTKKAIGYINEQAGAGQPFFLYFALPAPHTPILPSSEYIGKSNTNLYGDFVLQVDGVVGQITQTLKEQGILEETIIVFTSDNGASPQSGFEELARAGHDPSYIFRGHKADIFEGGLRVPFLVSWPEQISKSTTSGEVISTADLMATFADLTGYSVPDNAGEDSYSFLPVLLREDYSSPLREATVLHSIDGRFAIVKDQWKLILWPGSGGWSAPKTREEMKGLPAFQLYNLETDPSEENNLAENHPEKVKELQSLLEHYVTSGRSTPGTPQKNDGPPMWPQLNWMDSRPNVIIVITDDQGYGDLGCHGNEIIRTPHLDQFYSESVHLTNFHVSPTCAPTRAALMTGRYSNRTGVWHTIAGRSQLFRDEKIMAEVFSENGYKTGIVGKWHLGDNYPFRPIDRGFQEAVIHGGGGVGQGPDYWGNDLFDDTYSHNGKFQKYHGYATDVFFENALSFIEKNQQQPFFLYISTNAPHKPLHVPEKYYNLYKDEEQLPETQKRFYGMITNMDDNFKKLDDKLEQLGLKENTIVIFMTDNGTADGFQVRDGVFYGNDGGMRGRKGSEYEGGHRVPFFIRWPDGKLDQNRDIPTLTAHIDVLPTLIDLCNLHFEQKNPLDGKSLKSLLYNQPWPWLDRILISDSQRLQNLIKWRKSATMSNDWRLINGQELYNIKEDPKQTTNVANKHPDVFKKLHDAYDSWWATLDSAHVNQRYAYIIAGSPHENPVRISAHDLHVNRFDQMWHQVGALRGSRALGLFKVEFAESGTYQISLCRYPRESGYAINEHIPAVKTSVEVNRPMPESKPMNFSSAALYVGDFLETEKIEKGDKEVTFNVEMQKGKYDLKAMLMDDQGKRYPAYYLYIERKK